MRRGHGDLLVGGVAVCRAALRHAAPPLQLCAAAQPELRDGVAHVIFHGIAADPTAHGDPRVAHAVPNGVHDRPLGGRQHVVVRRAAPPLGKLAATGHGGNGSVPLRSFPSPWDRRAMTYRRPILASIAASALLACTQPEPSDADIVALDAVALRAGGCRRPRLGAACDAGVPAQDRGARRCGAEPGGRHRGQPRCRGHRPRTRRAVPRAARSSGRCTACPCSSKPASTRPIGWRPARARSRSPSTARAPMPTSSRGCARPAPSCSARPT